MLQKKKKDTHALFALLMGVWNKMRKFTQQNFTIWTQQFTREGGSEEGERMWGEGRVGEMLGEKGRVELVGGEKGCEGNSRRGGEGMLAG